MKTNKTIVFGLLAVVVASMILVSGGGITSAHAQASNVTSSRAAAWQHAKYSSKRLGCNSVKEKNFQPTISYIFMTQRLT